MMLQVGKLAECGIGRSSVRSELTKPTDGWEYLSHADSHVIFELRTTSKSVVVRLGLISLIS